MQAALEERCRRDIEPDLGELPMWERMNLVRGIVKSTLATYKPGVYARADWAWVDPLRRGAREYRLLHCDRPCDDQEILDAAVAAMRTAIDAGEASEPDPGALDAELEAIRVYMRERFERRVPYHRRHLARSVRRETAEALGEVDFKLRFARRYSEVARRASAKLGREVSGKTARRILTSRRVLFGNRNPEAYRNLSGLARRVFVAIENVRRGRHTVVWLDAICYAVLPPPTNKAHLSTNRTRVKRALAEIAETVAGFHCELVKRGKDYAVAYSRERRLVWTGPEIRWTPDSEEEHRQAARMAKAKRNRVLEGAEAIVQDAMDRGAVKKLPQERVDRMVQAPQLFGTKQTPYLRTKRRLFFILYTGLCTTDWWWTRSRRGGWGVSDPVERFFLEPFGLYQTVTGWMNRFDYHLGLWYLEKAYNKGESEEHILDSAICMLNTIEAGDLNERGLPQTPDQQKIKAAILREIERKGIEPREWALKVYDRHVYSKVGRPRRQQDRYLRYKPRPLSSAGRRHRKHLMEMRGLYEERRKEQNREYAIKLAARERIIPRRELAAAA